MTLRKIGVIGLGYVGLPLSFLLVKKGFDVLGIDIDRKKINHLKQGVSYLTDVSDQEVQEAFAACRFSVTDHYDALSAVDVIIVCVPTPLGSDHAPDTSFLEHAGAEIAKRVRHGQLVILESSTYPGTTRDVLKPLLEGNGLNVGKDIFLCYSPERIDPGNKEYPLERIPKLLGGVTDECIRRGCDMYSQVFDEVILVSSPEVAELAKLMENSYRFVNISFVNELTRICDVLKINLWEVIDAAKTKPYGFTPFFPGPGIGGHCIPVDPLYLQWKTKQYGLRSQFIELSDQINREMPEYLVDRIKMLSRPKDLREVQVLLYGAAYKRDINDVRESSIFELIRLLKQEGAKVYYHDPFVPSIFVEEDRMDSVDITEELLSQMDCTVIYTDHTQIPLQQILDHSRMVFDTRNATKGMQGKAKIYRLGGGDL
ncbi:nucleotide sugar dehydrogenase [Ammoniphilus sp. YIM 78166]|uniref:nucleotide sugar dehydrogenase n=1 Tax=Ammoniphilus sp. YIM 78166 TaxID=1644106 RepID=UPI00106F5CC7|nr:nucleotide sugar dehydrogenase [Ammoniphilus sp. YIM 78166]